MAVTSILMRFRHKPPTTYPHSLIFSRPFNNNAADNYLKILQNTKTSQSNLEKTLTKVRGKLDSSIVEEAIKRCHINNSLLGLRFFIWAGIQPDYRHTPYTYTKASKLFRQDWGTFSHVFETYREENCSVSVNMFKVVLNLCREAKLAEDGLRVLRMMGEFDCRPDTTVFNVVIGLFCEKGEMDVACGLMKEMGLVDLYPDVSTYIAMVKGFCNVGRVEEGCGLVKVMCDHGCVPNVVVFSILLDGFCKIGNFDRAVEFLGEMEKEGSGGLPNVVTYTALMQRFCENGRIVEALTVLDRMGSRGCFPNRVTVATLIKALCSEGNIEGAYKLIDRVLINGSVSKSECYSSLVVALLQNKFMDEADKLFRWMLGNQIKPDGLACSLFVKKLCLEGKILIGFEYFAEMEKTDCLSSVDSDIYSILLAGLCQRGHMVEAASLINVMVKRNIKLKAMYTRYILESLQNSGEKELGLNLMSMLDNIEHKDSL